MEDIFFLIEKSMQYGFMQKALLCGIFISVASSILGIFLVLRKYSLISDGLSHVSFTAVAIALTAGISPVAVSIPIVILASLLIYKLSEKANVYSDAAIGLVSAVGVAAGVTIISMGQGFNIDIYSYLFGSILAVTSFDVYLSLIIAAAVIIITIFYRKELFMITFDEDYALVSKVNVKLINSIMTVVQSIVIVIGIKIVGAMLMSSLIIFPAIISLQVAKSFKSMVIYSVSLSVFSVVFGIFGSFILNSPTGASIVIVNVFLFIIFYSANSILKIK